MSVFSFITNLPELIGPVFWWEVFVLWLLLANTINILFYVFWRKTKFDLLQFEKSFSILLGNLGLTIGFIGTLIGLIQGLGDLKPGDPTAIPKVFAAISNSIWSTVGGSIISAIALVSHFLAERFDNNNGGLPETGQPLGEKMGREPLLMQPKEVVESEN